jgi:hypothetical protein
MKRLILLLTVLIFAISCSDIQHPQEVLNPEKLSAVLKDVHLTEAYFNTLPSEDSIKKIAPAYYAQLFKKHQISYQQFEQSLKFYTQKPVLLDSIYSQINAELRKSNQLKGAKGKKFAEELSVE